jgi:hypothetical protein
MTTVKASRRNFIKTLATVPLVPAFIVATLPVTGGSGSGVSQQAPAEPSSAARALTGVVRARYGTYITAIQLDEVQKDIESGLKTSQRLRALKLKNGDEPDFIFSAA